MKVHELAFGKRMGIIWKPWPYGSWRVYRGSGHRFLCLGRLTFWVRWAYE